MYKYDSVNPMRKDCTMNKQLLPCPFCGAGETIIKENGKVWMGSHYGEPSSVSVHHYCEPVVGQPHRGLERVGKDRQSAINAWNLRTPIIKI